jgi:trimethylamine-N-oxide reductase (cytochrome c)
LSASDEKDKKLTRRGFIKWTTALAAVGAAVVGLGVGYGADLLSRPNATKTSTQVSTETATQTSTLTAPAQTVTQTSTSTATATTTETTTQTTTQTPTPDWLLEVKTPHASLTGPFWVYTKDGVIARTEQFDSETHVSPFERSWRKRVYAADRVQYPMRRVDFDPNGNRNPQNRGKSGYVRISWDEAATLVANEMTRAKSLYGNEGIFTMIDTGWSSAGTMVSEYTSVLNRLLNLFGGYTNPVGYYSEWALEIGEKYTVGQAVSESGANGSTTWQNIWDNTKAFVLWGGNPTVTTHMASFGDYIPSLFMQTKAKGIPFYVVDPRFNETAVALGATWIPILPGTDNAMLAAMAYVMITNNTYDSGFLATNAVGFDQFKDYILGNSDGVAKTPAWAEAICGVPAQTITNMANLITSQKPVLMSSGCGPQRGANGDTFQRMFVTVTAMSGNFGINGGGYGITPWGSGLGMPSGMFPVMAAMPSLPTPANPVTTWLIYNRWADAVLNPGGTYKADCQSLTYPTLKFLWKMTGVNWVNQHSDINKAISAIRAVDFYVSQDIWMVPSSKYADVILPACTTLEHNDIAGGWNYLVYMQQAIQPLYESLSDYDICSLVASKLGLGDAYTEGNTWDQWVQSVYASTKAPLSWADFTSQGFIKFTPKTMGNTAAFADFRADPTKNPLATPSGLIEIFSQRISDFYGANYPGVPTVPQFVEPYEWKGSALAATYPLAQISPHNTFRIHSQFDNVSWLRERSKTDDYSPLWINSIDAKARGIADGDVVRVFNGRGQAVAAAKVTERIMPGVVSLTEGSWFNPSNPADPSPLDLGGNPNTLTSDQGTSELAQATSSHTSLVQVEKLAGA